MVFGNIAIYSEIKSTHVKNMRNRIWRILSFSLFAGEGYQNAFIRLRQIYWINLSTLPHLKQSIKYFISGLHKQFYIHLNTRFWRDYYNYSKSISQMHVVIATGIKYVTLCFWKKSRYFDGTLHFSGRFDCFNFKMYGKSMFQSGYE